MLFALVAFVAIVAAALGVALWAPVDFSLAVERQTELRVHGQVSWLWGHVTTVVGDDSQSRPYDRRTARSAKSEPHGSSRSHMWRTLRTKAFLRGAVRLVGRVATEIEVRRAELWARGGLDDPADTGQLFAYAYPLT